MNKILNKKINLELRTLEQDVDNNQFVEITTNAVFSYSHLIIQLIKISKDQSGIGDLEEQYIRLKIMEKAKTSKVNQEINLEKEEINLLKELLPFFKLIILHEDLVKFQEDIINL